MAEVRKTAPAEARWLGGYHAKVTVRQFEAEVDEPPSAGGADAGPMPTEHLLIALASCFALAIAHVARRDGIEVAPFSVTAEGTYAGPRLSSFELVVDVEGGPPPEMDELLAKARRVCYISNTLAQPPVVVSRVAE